MFYSQFRDILLPYDFRGISLLLPLDLYIRRALCGYYVYLRNVRLTRTRAREQRNFRATRTNTTPFVRYNLLKLYVRAVSVYRL